MYFPRVSKLDLCESWKNVLTARLNELEVNFPDTNVCSELSKQSKTFDADSKLQLLGEAHY